MAGKSNGHNMETDWARAPPPPGTAWERFSKVIYNPEDNSCLGRTPQRWAIVLVFYGVFYAVLAAMFTACMAGLFYTLEENKPAYTLSSSLIGDNPGVSYRPIPPDEKSFNLWYHVSNVSESHPIITQLDTFLEPYKGDTEYSKQKECNSGDSYGFPMTPCFFIKVNKIYGWVPDYYGPSELPADMPVELKTHIGSLPPAEQKQVWVSCWDEKGNTTAFTYPWGYGMKEANFPYENTLGYKAPLVAVKVTKLATRTQITIRCRAWAKNIVYNKSIKEARGYARILFFADQEEDTEAAA